MEKPPRRIVAKGLSPSVPNVVAYPNYVMFTKCHHLQVEVMLCYQNHVELAICRTQVT